MWLIGGFACRQGDWTRAGARVPGSHHGIRGKWGGQENHTAQLKNQRISWHN